VPRSSAYPTPPPLPEAKFNRQLSAIWQTFVRSSLGTGLAVVARAIGSLLLSKLIAMYGGVGSLTQFAQFQSLMSLFGSLPSDGVQVGATTRLAPLPPGTPRYSAWLGAAGIVTMGLVAVSGGLLWLLDSAAWSPSSAALFTLGMAAITGQALLSTALLAAGRQSAYVVQVIILSTLGTIAAGGALLLRQPLSQVMGYYLAGQSVAVLPALMQAHRVGLLRGWRAWPISRAAVRGLLRFVLMASGTLVFGRVIDYEVRAYLIGHFAPASTDLWQAVDRLSGNYSLVVATVLSTVFYPRLAALAVIPAQARRYLLAVLGLLAVGLAIGLGLIFALRDVLLPLLFAPRLLAARELLAPQLLGDWAKFLSWVFLYQVLARARPLPYLGVQAASAALYAALLAWLLPRLGLSGVVWAHAIRYGLLLGACSLHYGLANKEKLFVNHSLTAN
jgi:PST family polysaccharide transporter